MMPAPKQESNAGADTSASPRALSAPEELSEEDQKLKDDLELLVEKLNEPSRPNAHYSETLSAMKSSVRESTTSMTAVPKPLKFLRPHYPVMTDLYEKWSCEGAARKPAELVVQLADVLSVLAMTYSDGGKRESLKYRFLSSEGSVADWGHEYMRNLALEIGEAYQESLGADNEYTAQLVAFSLQIVPFFLKHNAEADAVDLLLEVESIEKLPPLLDDATYARVCLYMVSCVPLLSLPDDVAFLLTAYSIYLSHKQLTQALTLAIKLDDKDLMKQVFEATDDVLVHKQLGFILSGQCNHFSCPNKNADVQEIISNVKLPEYFSYLAKELNLLEPKVPEDIYKSYLEDSRVSFGSGSIDSAKQNLAASFVNGFINMGFCNDKLVFLSEESKSWIYKTKGTGMISATAAVGSIYQWNIDDGLQALNKYSDMEDPDIKAGAILGTGIVSANINDEVKAAFALLQEFVTDPKKLLQTSAITGLGIAFAGSANEEVLALLYPLISDTDIPLEVSCLAALALGHVFVGSSHGDITTAILQTLLERSFVQLNNKYIRFMAMGLGLLYMGKTDLIDDVFDIIDAIEHPINKTLKVLINICAYAGTGNVLQIQSLLQICSAKPKKEKKKGKDEKDDETEKSKSTESESSAIAKSEALASSKDVEIEDAGEHSSETKAESEETLAATSETNDDAELEEDESEEDEAEKMYQGIAVLGLACIAMGENIGHDMVLRQFSHLMHYGNGLIRRAVPLAMGIVSASHPQMKVFDTLSRFTHDPDLEISQNAIYAMGLVGAGTNNARLAQLLRQLAQYYSKSPDSLFIVRIAQGLLYLGKGTLTLTPFNIERNILNKVSLAALLTVSMALLYPKAFILNDSTSDTTHQLLYYLTPAIKPKMLITVDENLEPIKVNVRVGQAVDVVGQAGKPKTITGWVTQATPVLLNYGERAELETNEYISLSHSLEDIVILKKAAEDMDVDN